MRTGVFVGAAASLVLAGLVSGCSSTSGAASSATAAAGSAASSAASAASAVASAASSAVSSAASAATAAGEKFTIGYAGAVQANPNNKAVEDGIKSQAASLGMDVVVTDANFDANKQISDVKSLVQQGVDALIIWPIDPKGIQPALDDARKANIPIIVQDTPDAGQVTSNFQVNNEQAAQQAAELVGQTVGTGSDVAVVQGLPIVGVLAARNVGFEKGAQGAGLNVVAKQVNEKDNADGARPIVDAWKSQYGAKLKGILAYNDPSALGAASAVGGDFTPVVVGMNGDSDGVAAVKDGRLLATWDFRPVELGNGLAWAANQVLTGKSIPATVNVEMTKIDKANADSWKPIADRLAAPMSVALEDRGGQSYLTTS